MAPGTVKSRSKRSARGESTAASLHSSAESVPAPEPGVDAKHITLNSIGVKYRLMTDDQRTLRGRLIGMLNGSGATADFWALRNVSLTIGQGEVVGIVGGNGSGKSTLMRVMSRIIDPIEGQVDVVGEISPMLELGGAFSADLTGRENAYLNAALHRIGREEMTALMPEVQAFADIGPFFDVPVKTYSSGMVSRLAFAVAVQTRPDILLIDEVFSVGDENFQRKSAMRMKKLIDQGVIVVLVTHNTSLIRQVCNRAIWLDRGELKSDGKPGEVVEAYLRHVAR